MEIVFNYRRSREEDRRTPQEALFGWKFSKISFLDSFVPLGVQGMLGAARCEWRFASVCPDPANDKWRKCSEYRAPATHPPLKPSLTNRAHFDIHSAWRFIAEIMVVNRWQEERHSFRCQLVQKVELGYKKQDRSRRVVWDRVFLRTFFYSWGKK